MHIVAIVKLALSIINYVTANKHNMQMHIAPRLSNNYQILMQYRFPCKLLLVLSCDLQFMAGMQYYQTHTVTVRQTQK